MDSETRSIWKCRKTQETVTFESNGNFPPLIMTREKIFSFASNIKYGSDSHENVKKKSKNPKRNASK